MKGWDLSDPFEAYRRLEGQLTVDFVGEEIPLILRHADVRDAAMDWQRFSSDAPFRVPIPPEDGVRRVRQIQSSSIHRKVRVSRSSSETPLVRRASLNTPIASKRSSSDR